MNILEIKPIAKIRITLLIFDLLKITLKKEFKNAFIFLDIKLFDLNLKRGTLL
jgi:hypothetical protein